MIRYSVNSDREEIEHLIMSCFGHREDLGVFDNLEGRYLLKIVDNKIVAMTGLEWAKEYEALEVAYTGTLPEYRHQGYMQELFAYMLNDIQEDVYCSCWRLPGKDINLRTIMEMFGFIEVVKPRTTWCIGHNCHRSDVNNNICTFYSGASCYCCEDLYLRKHSPK